MQERNHTPAYPNISCSALSSASRALTGVIGMVIMAMITFIIPAAAQTGRQDPGYVASLRPGTMPGATSPRNFAAYYCTDGAAYRLTQKGVPFHNQWPTGTGRWGNAYEWETRANELGFHVLPDGSRAFGRNGIVLRANALADDVAIWRARSANPYGHVAYCLTGGTASANLLWEYNWTAFQFGYRYVSQSAWLPSVFLGINPPRNANALSVVAEKTNLSAKVGNIVETRLRVTNNGTNPLTITSTNQIGSAPILGRTNNLNNVVLAPRASAFVGVMFRPGALACYATTFTIASDGGMKSVTIGGIGTR